MKNICVLLTLTLLCSACGPKNVGESDMVTPDNHAALAPEGELRTPMMGNRTQQRLYYFNHPEVMQYRLDIQRDLIHRATGSEKAPNDYTNLQPRQASPFRQ